MSNFIPFAYLNVPFNCYTYHVYSNPCNSCHKCKTSWDLHQFVILRKTYSHQIYFHCLQNSCFKREMEESIGDS